MVERQRVLCTVPRVSSQDKLIRVDQVANEIVGFFEYYLAAIQDRLLNADI